MSYFGRFLTSFSAVGCYLVVVPETTSEPAFTAEIRAQTTLHFQAMVAGFQGLMNLTVLWLGMPLLSASGFEPFAWPDPAQLRTLAIGATLAAVGNVTLLVALALLPNPLVVSVGTLLTTPVNYAVDLVLHSDAARSVGALDLAGAAMVVASFAAVVARDFALVGRASSSSGDGKGSLDKGSLH